MHATAQNTVIADFSFAGASSRSRKTLEIPELPQQREVRERATNAKEEKIKNKKSSLDSHLSFLCDLNLKAQVTNCQWHLHNRKSLLELQLLLPMLLGMHLSINTTLSYINPLNWFTDFTMKVVNLVDLKKMAS
ncbi:hypothetical protein V6N13_045127 [Hibiscus sabdariffa]